MNATLPAYCTSFGQYVPLDYETYKKLKLVKSCYNVSRLKSLRHNKWGFKAERNRSANKPDLCPQFHTAKDEEHQWYGEWDRSALKFKKFSRTISKSEDTGLGHNVMKAWAKAQPKISEADVEQIDFGFDLDVLYNACLPYYEKNCKQS